MQVIAIREHNEIQNQVALNGGKPRYKDYYNTFCLEQNLPEGYNEQKEAKSVSLADYIKMKREQDGEYRRDHQDQS